MIAHKLADKGRWLRGVPMRRRNLRPRQSYQAVAAFQRVIEESELMVPRQRRQPQRKAGQVDGTRVPVDAVKTALSDEPAGMKLLVLVRQDRPPLVLELPPHPHEPLADRP